MQTPDFIAISPIIMLAGTAAAVMLLIALRRNHGATAALTTTGLAASLAVLLIAARVAPRQVTPLFTIDPFAIFFTGLILGATIVSVLLAYGYMERLSGLQEEFYLLLVVAALGSVVLVASRHFASFFLGLEILSVSLYALVAYTRSRVFSIEAGIKYLVLAAVSSAFMLYGTALIYADQGSLDFVRIAELIQKFHGNDLSMTLLAGTGLVIVAVGFKLAVVPFHMWTPDIYQGAPAPVTGFVASVSKGAMAALLVRLFAPIDLHHCAAMFGIFAGFAVASMLAGNLLALMQANVKRMLAYSSIAHMGYLLVAFLVGGRFAVSAVAFYITAYCIGILGCFGVISLLSDKDRDADSMEDFRGLFFTRPWLAAVFTAMLFSLAGIPMTAGFIAKFYVAAAGIKDALWLLVIVLVLTSGVGLFYYLRVIIIMYERKPAGAPAPLSLHVPDAPGNIALAFLLICLLWLGIVPPAFLLLSA